MSEETANANDPGTANAPPETTTTDKPKKKRTNTVSGASRTPVKKSGKKVATKKAAPKPKESSGRGRASEYAGKLISRKGEPTGLRADSKIMTLSYNIIPKDGGTITYEKWLAKGAQQKDLAYFVRRGIVKITNSPKA